jgi:putative oxidoreductase
MINRTTKEVEMIRKLMQTQNDAGALLTRVALGVVMFPHGAQKVLGWWGGHGLTATLDTFTAKMGIPLPFALAAIGAEFLGALGLVVGLGTRVAAFGIGVTMVVAATMHLENGFFMNWFGQQEGEGIEYHLLAIGMAAALVIRGAGSLSLDGLLAKRGGAS